MKDALPKFAAPPVVETVISVQFELLNAFTSAHAGWFWKNHLDQSWSSVREVPRIQDQYERFGDDKRWGASKLTVRTSPQVERLQIIREDQERMIQLQNTRFIYNWRKGKEGYPSYETLLPEFKAFFSEFEEFALGAGNSHVAPNQWEITYVNHILKGDLWNEPNEWVNIFPWFLIPATSVMGQSLDGFQGEWQLIIGDELGRLHISLTHARIGAESGPEGLVLQFTARGPLNAEKGINTLDDGFNLGHESIVRSFADMTSEWAHKYWKREI